MHNCKKYLGLPKACGKSKVDTLKRCMTESIRELWDGRKSFFLKREKRC